MKNRVSVIDIFIYGGKCDIDFIRKLPDGGIDTHRYHRDKVPDYVTNFVHKSSGNGWSNNHTVSVLAHSTHTSIFVYNGTPIS